MGKESGTPVGSPGAGVGTDLAVEGHRWHLAPRRGGAGMEWKEVSSRSPLWGTVHILLTWAQREEMRSQGR